MERIKSQIREIIADMRRAPRKNREPKKVQLLRLVNIKMPKLDWKILVLAVLALALVSINFLVIPAVKSSGPPRIKQQQAAKISETVHAVLSEFAIPPQHISRDDSVTQIKIPHEFDFFAIYKAIRSSLAAMNAEIVSCRKATGTSILMSVGKNEQVVDHFLFVKSKRLEISRGSVALVIDDFGYSFNETTRKFLALDIPLTISIIPGLAYSQRIADIAKLHRKEILIHMPMEPLNEPYEDNGFTLISGQDPGMVSLRVRKAFAQLPAAGGLNNHQGSKVTINEEMMQSVMYTLKSLNKFFIDSRTNVNSLAYTTAQQIGLPSNENNMFIDTTDNVDFIEKQLLQMGATAKEQGQIIAIGHVRENTLRALERSISKLKTMGVTFVYASDILN